MSIVGARANKMVLSNFLLTKDFTWNYPTPRKFHLVRHLPNTLRDFFEVGMNINYVG
jgi:hypothetical protein